MMITKKYENKSVTLKEAKKIPLNTKMIVAAKAIDNESNNQKSHCGNKNENKEKKN